MTFLKGWFSLVLLSLVLLLLVLPSTVHLVIYVQKWKWKFNDSFLNWFSLTKLFFLSFFFPSSKIWKIIKDNWPMTSSIVQLGNSVTFKKLLAVLYHVLFRRNFKSLNQAYQRTGSLISCLLMTIRVNLLSNHLHTDEIHKGR